jgi:hypothetical protein
LGRKGRRPPVAEGTYDRHYADTRLSDAGTGHTYGGSLLFIGDQNGDGAEDLAVAGNDAI